MLLDEPAAGMNPQETEELGAFIRDIKELKLKPAQRFRELLGHTRTEVLWGMVIGIAWATLICHF